MSTQQGAILLFGGNSEERLVSVASAQNLAEQYSFAKLLFQAPDEKVYEVGPAELRAHRDSFVKEFQPESTKPMANNLTEAIPFLKGHTLFLGYHGSQGEDGQVQKLFESHGIAFTGSGSQASHDAFDKHLAKKIIQKTSVKTAISFEFNLKNRVTQKTQLETFLKNHRKMVMKPTTSGSSFGLQIVGNEAQLEAALQQMQTLPFETYLVENFITGRELTVAVANIDGKMQALPASEVVLNEGHSFDYNGKYLGAGTTELTPAPISEAQMKAAQQVALESHQALGCYGYSRTDMILAEDGIYFLETNTLPGMTKASFVPQQLTAAQMKLSDFIARQLKLAELRYTN